MTPEQSEQTSMSSGSEDYN